MQGLRRIIAAAAVMLLAATTIAATPEDRDRTRSGCSGTLRARPSEITLHLEDRAGLARAARDEMMRRTTMVWRAAGVDVRWSPDPSSGGNATDGGTHLRVAITAEVAPSSSPAPRPMASIRFVDGKPSTSIDVYLSEVRELLDVFVLDERPLTHRPSLLQQQLMGRVLGRAVAHEIGHVVFGSGHARSGLMRPTHRLDQLIGRTDQPFTIIEPPVAACGQHP